MEMDDEDLAHSQKNLAHSQKNLAHSQMARNISRPLSISVVA
jgi:hypothetical protein